MTDNIPRQYLACEKTALFINNELKLYPALITLHGKKIEKIERCTPEEYSEKIKHWQDIYGSHFSIFHKKMITPAFVNNHTHLAMNFFRALSPSKQMENMVEEFFWAHENKLTSAMVRAFTRMGAYESILNGTGFVWDHYFFGTEIAQALKDVGLSGAIAPTANDVYGPFKGAHHFALEQTLQIHADEDLKTHGIYAVLGPHAPDSVSPVLWQKILQLADQYNLPLHFHLGQSFDEVNRMRQLGFKTSTSYLESLGIWQSAEHVLAVHGIFVTESDLKIIKEHNHTLCFCPFSQLIFCYPADVCMWEEKGVRWVLGTDCVASNDSMNVQKELRYVSGFPKHYFTVKKQNFTGDNLRKKIDEFMASQANTHMFNDSTWLLGKVWQNSSHLHPEVKVGQIAEGFLANMVVWDLEHPSLWPHHFNLRSISHGDTSSAIYNMMIAGKWLGNSGDFHKSILESESYKTHREEAGFYLKKFHS